MSSARVLWRGCDTATPQNGEPAPKQATSRKSRCKLLEVDQTDEINLRRVFWNLPKSKYFANRKTRTTTKNRTTTYRTIQYAPRDAGMKYSGLTPTKCSKVRLFLVTAQGKSGWIFENLATWNSMRRGDQQPSWTEGDPSTRWLIER